VQRTLQVAIESVPDIVTARQEGRRMALQLGFSETEATIIATVISEVARNIVLYARTGEIYLEPINSGSRDGIMLVARDEGPGIANLERALMGGYSTSGGLGLGLSGIRRIVDEFNIESVPGRGTTVTAKKWLD
jgi:serine/threonine-protein kinase RsbT